MTVHATRVFLAALLAVLWPAMAPAQIMSGSYTEAGPGRPAISATGTSTIQQKPTQLRLYVQLAAHSPPTGPSKWIPTTRCY